MNRPVDPADAFALAVQGDQAAFGAVLAPYERSLFRHCYRMLGSGPDAEDALQDTLIRAWRRLATYDASGAFAGWLYRIATNVCFDHLRSRQARRVPAGVGPPSQPDMPLGAPDASLAWVEPVANRSLTSIDDPQNDVVRREDISLAFVAALHRLTPRQRACLLLHDVLGFTHAEVADALAVTEGVVNSLLFRARQAALPRHDEIRADPADPLAQQLLDRYVQAWLLADIDAFVEIVADDVKFSMPPFNEWFEGRDAVATFVGHLFDSARPHGIPLRPGWCNGQPAFATYERDTDRVLVASGLQILSLADQDGQMVITDIVSYRNADLPIRCGLPPSIGVPF
jgi:RNA polymerase sigma-70 factor (ECF subfamily)